MSRTISPRPALPTVADAASPVGVDAAAGPRRPRRTPVARAALESRAIADLQAAFARLRCMTAQRLMYHGVSLANLHLLQLLDAHGELTMGRVAHALDVSMSNATGLVDRMADRGLVERHRDVADRRVVHVHITEAGRAVLGDMDAIREGPLRAVLGRLDDDALGRLAAAAADLHHAADAEVRLRQGPAPDAGSCPVVPSTGAATRT